MKNKLLNVCFLLISLILLCFCISNKNFFIENFIPTNLKIFPNCTPQNNCYPGSYITTQKYSNMCQPIYGLNRQKIQLRDNCLKNLGKPSKELYIAQNLKKPQKNLIQVNKSSGNKLSHQNVKSRNFYCFIDKHLGRHCFWK